MLRRVLCFVSALWLLIHISVLSAYAREQPVSAASAVVIDAATRTVLFEKNAYIPRPIASTTKMMTCLLACESKKLCQSVTVTPEMLLKSEGTSLNLKAGDCISLYDLTVGAMLSSGNDAANAIAYALAGSKGAFCALMNRRAESIGMQNTYFATPSGLDENNHHSTAFDMALLGAAAMENEVFAAIAAMRTAQITVNGVVRSIANHNKLLQRDAGFTGIKTGYTKKAGRCLVSAYKHEGNTLIAVTLNAPDDWNDHDKLVKAAVSRYDIYSDSGRFIVNCVGAQHASVACAYRYRITALEKPMVKLYYYPIIYAPLHKNEKIGYAELICRGICVGTVAITVQEDISYGKQE